MPSVRRRLDEAGVELIEAVGRNEYTARLSIAQKGQVDALPFVSATRLYQ